MLAISRNVLLGALGAAIGILYLGVGVARAEDVVMWGGTPARNMVNAEKNPPMEWDGVTGKNIGVRGFRGAGEGDGRGEGCLGA